MYGETVTRLDAEISPLEAARGLVADDLVALDRSIISHLESDVVLINQVAQYIVHAGGKRLRPLIVLLAARACGYADAKHVTMAAIVEFIHTATLLHDDVVDESGLRRGRETANAVFGNQASVLVGDFLYSRAFQMMVEVGEMPIMNVMAGATNTIAEGEVLQLLNCNDPDTTEARYLDVIRCKTAMLFDAGSRCAALLSGQPPETVEAMGAYGMHLGVAFQLVDDALDYSASADEMGKNTGDDLAEGKPTLPLIHAMHNGDEEQRALIRLAVEQGGLDNLEAIQGAIESTGALNYTARLAQREVDAACDALQALPDSAYRDALSSLARFAIDRTS